MSMRKLESGIINEVRQITGRRSLRVKDMAEWSTSETQVRLSALASEEIIFCPDYHV